MENNGKNASSPAPKPVHSFDLWGVVAHQHILGERKVKLYKALSRKAKVSEDIIGQVVKDYVDMLDGQPWATGARKSEIIDAIDAPTFAAGIYPDYSKGFISDALVVMRDILDAGQGVIIFTSKPAPGLDRQLVVALGEKIDEICFDDKHHPNAFKTVYDRQLKHGNHIVSHTADELPELIAAKKSGLFHPDGLIYINRNDSNSSEHVKSEGIIRYVDDLRTVNYTTLTNKTSPTGKYQDYSQDFS